MQCAGLARLVLCAGLLGSSACAFSFGEDQLDVVETGVPADATTQPFLPWLLRDVHLLVGADGSPWLAAGSEDSDSDPSGSSSPPKGVSGPLALYQLTPPYGRGGQLPFSQAQSFFPPAPSHSICSYRQDPGGHWLVSFRHPEDESIAEFPSGPLVPQILCGQRTMAFWQPSADNADFEVLRFDDDGRLQHSRLPWPLGARSDLQQGPLSFDDREEVVLVNDSDYHTLAYYLDTPEQIDLGVLYWGQTRSGQLIHIDFDGLLHVFHISLRVQQPINFRLGPDGQILGIDEQRHEVITCDWDGLRAVSVPQAGQAVPVLAPQRVLDSTPCLASTSLLTPLSSVVVYTPVAEPPGSEVRAVRLDSPNSTQAKVLLHGSGGRILGLCQDRAVAYSLDPVDRYGPSVSDGWIGGYRFMERGREVRFSPDCGRVYFKEHAANARKLGELRAAAVPPSSGANLEDLPPQRRLARNVGFTRVAPDGRLLTATDLGVIGPQNRLLLIDERPAQPLGEAQALMHSINSVTGALFIGAFLPGRREVLLEVRDTEPGRQAGLLLLTLPPR